MSTPRAGAGDRRLWVDVGIACLVPTVQLVLLVATGALRPWDSADVLTIALVLAQGVPLAARRSHPWAVFLVVLAANSAYYALGLPPTGYDLGLAFALYSVAEQRPIGPSLLAYGVVVTEILLMKVAAVGPYWRVAPWFLVVYLCVFFGAAWLWGRYQHVRAARLRDLVVQADRDRTAAAETAVREERTRIARELHDVIAHHLSLMVVQAGGARRLVEQDPVKARQALSVIEEYGRRGLDAMPGLLKALRSEPSVEDRSPAPRLADLQPLVDQLARSGQPVTLTVRGQPRALPDTIELSAYRIVQESLTNAVRHAPGARVAVEVGFEPDRLLVEVTDDGPGLGGRRDGGQGLTGMRERARLLGGTWEIGESGTGGCRVRACLPCPAGEPS